MEKARRVEVRQRRRRVLGEGDERGDPIAQRQRRQRAIGRHAVDEVGGEEQ
jgi:hypothetical protein